MIPTSDDIYIEDLSTHDIQTELIDSGSSEEVYAESKDRKIILRVKTNEEKDVTETIIEQSEISESFSPEITSETV